jgi:hypothetical protein
MGGLRSGTRQKVLILYLANSSLDAPVVGWSVYDGTGQTLRMPGDEDEPPYRTGLDALLDGWRLLQMSQLLPHIPGAEFTTSYQKYEFLFEKLEEAPDVRAS